MYFFSKGKEDTGKKIILLNLITQLTGILKYVHFFREAHAFTFVPIALNYKLHN